MNTKQKNKEIILDGLANMSIRESKELNDLENELLKNKNPAKKMTNEEFKCFLRNTSRYFELLDKRKMFRLAILN